MTELETEPVFVAFETEPVAPMLETEPVFVAFITQPVAEEG